MKKRTLILGAIGICLVSYIVGYFVGDSAATDRFNRSTTAQSNKEYKDIQKAADKAVSKEETKDKAKTYKLGEEGQSGNWKIKILDTQETNTIQSGDGSQNKTTQQKFIVLKLQMTNITQAAVQYSDDEFTLGNIKDKKQYQLNGDDSLTATQVETTYKNNSSFFDSVDSLNPSTPKDTYLVFEVPKDFNVADGVLMHKGNGDDVAVYYIK